MLHTSIEVVSRKLNCFNYSYLTHINSRLIICCHTVKWLQVLLFNTNYSIERYSFICTQSNSSKYCYVIPIFKLSHTVKEFRVLLINAHNSIQHYSCICTQLNCSKYCYVSQTIQLNICHLFAHSLNVSSIRLKDRILSGATIPGQSRHESNVREGIFHIPPNSSITGASSLNGLVSYPGHSFGRGSYPSAEMQSVYCTAPADWVSFFLMLSQMNR